MIKLTFKEWAELYREKMVPLVGDSGYIEKILFAMARDPLCPTDANVACEYIFERLVAPYMSEKEVDYLAFCLTLLKTFYYHAVDEGELDLPYDQRPGFEGFENPYKERFSDRYLKPSCWKDR